MSDSDDRSTLQAGDLLVDRPQPTSVRWIVLAIVAFASSSAYLTRYCMSAAKSTIQQDLGFDETQYGMFFSSFSLGYLLCQIPGGWLGTRFGTRFAFAFSSVVWSLSNFWSGMAFAFGTMWASRFSLGMFQAGLTPLSAKIIKDWIPLKHRGISSASIGACMSLGGAFTLSLTGWLLDRDYGWRRIFNAYSLVGIAWGVGFYWFFRTFPEEHKSVNKAELDLIREQSQAPPAAAEETNDSRADVTERSVEPLPPPAALTGLDLFVSMLRSRSLWGLCVQSFFRAAGYVFFVTWFFNFLEHVYGISKAEAGVLNSLPLIAVIAGTTSGGVIVDFLLRKTGSKWISRSGTAFVALMICSFFTMASAWTSSATELAIVIAIGAMFSGIGSPAAWAATIDVGGRQTALFVGTMNMAGCLAGVVLPIVLGKWFDELKETGGNWDNVIYLHAAFYFAGAVAWLAVNPNDTPAEQRGQSDVDR